MLPDVADIQNLTLAELTESEADLNERAADCYAVLLDKGSAKRTEDELYYQKLIKLRDCLREEISRRTQLIADLSDLTVLELKELSDQYDREVTYWRNEFIRSVHGEAKHSRYQAQAEQTGKQIRDEIAGRMSFLHNLEKLSMTELALKEAVYHKAGEKHLAEHRAASDEPGVSESHRRKHAVSLEMRDMLRAEIFRRRRIYQNMW